VLQLLPVLRDKPSVAGSWRAEIPSQGIPCDKTVAAVRLVRPEAVAKCAATPVARRCGTLLARDEVAVQVVHRIVLQVILFLRIIIVSDV
jgi:hypothetical protein